MPEDYTFEAMESRMRKAKGSPLTSQEREHIQEQADEIAILEKSYEAAKKEEEEAALDADVTRVHEAMVREVEAERADNSEDGNQELNPFVVGLLAILFLPAGFLYYKMKLNRFWAGSFGSVPILIPLAFAGWGIFRLIKWIF